MKLVALTPEKELYQGEVTSVKLPGVGGQFEILNNHAPIVAALAAGEVRIIKDSGERLTFNILKGFVEVINNEVSVLIQALAKEDKV
jgi:F-type H+-transporting ATPase subunit epsilon